jgi:translation initiation factor 2 beta subunit (eIF-2beta)/eIF-5
MTSISGNTVNMDGSLQVASTGHEINYRYTMPALVVKHEGSSKMKKTVLVNLVEVSRHVGRPAEYLLTYLSQNLQAAAKTEKDGGKMYIAGHHDPKAMQELTIVFVKEFVMCKECANPETSCVVTGTKKNKELYLDCGGCGARRHLDSDRFVKYMVKHLPQDPVQGHAQMGRGATTEAVAMASQLADAQQEEKVEKKKEKRTCPNPSCGHRSSKEICSKCGTAMDSEGCRSLVEIWMNKHQADPPSDQLSAVIEIVTDEASKECASTSEKLQPASVSKMASSAVQKWSSVVADLCDELGSDDAFMDIVTASVLKAAASHLDTCTERTRETIVIGVLLCLRDNIDAITDDCILSSCKRLPSCGVAMEEFIKFLESGSDDESDAE